MTGIDSVWSLMEPPAGRIGSTLRALRGVTISVCLAAILLFLMTGIGCFWSVIETTGEISSILTQDLRGDTLSVCIAAILL
jgi:hypothetical protein